jgi:glycosyltransferase involved in cell wall biosynthesis
LIMPAEVALCVITYQRPRHLRLALESIARQRGITGGLEVIVSDDGSTDDTPQVVRQFAEQALFPVKFLTHPHQTFQAARCRNKAAAAATAPYLMFVDGDCILPPNHVATHLAQRRPGTALIGDCVYLSQQQAANVDTTTIARGQFGQWLTFAERRRLWGIWLKYAWYNLRRHPRKPYKLRSGDFSIHRADFERVNGFDENFCGWGGEDDDLGRRLRKAGMRLQSIVNRTFSFHLWHPRDTTAPAQLRTAQNTQYLWRKGRLTRCRNGLVKRPLTDVTFRVVGQPTETDRAQQFLARHLLPTSSARAEVEVLFLPGSGKFTGQADCNLLVVLDEAHHDVKLVQSAHIVVTPTHTPTTNKPHFRLDQWDAALAAVA